MGKEPMDVPELDEYIDRYYGIFLQRRYLKWDIKDWLIFMIAGTYIHLPFAWLDILHLCTCAKEYFTQTCWRF